MTVSSSVNKSGPYAGAGIAGPFTVGFRFLAASHLRVIKTSAAGVDTDLTLTTDYTVSGVGASSGSVTLTAPLLPGEKLTIVRDVPFTQEADYVANDPFPAESHEQALDLLTMQTQQLKERTDAALTLPERVTGVSTELPAPVGGNVIGWDEAGTALRNISPATLASIIAYSSRQVLVANGGAAFYTLASDPGVIANTQVAVNGVLQTPNVDYTLSGTTLTPTTPFPAGTGNVVIVYGQALPVGSVTPDQMPYDATAAYVASTLGGHTLGDPVDPHDFPWLAVGDGSADDAAKLNAALAYAASSGRRIVQLRNKTYRCTASILLNAQGLQLRGLGQLATTLLIDHTSGPGVNISQPYCQLSDLTVRASTTRANFTTGGTYDLATGLFGVQIYNNGGFMTQTRIDRVWSMSHPNNGFYMGGEGADSMFINCAAYSNRGHGYYFDGRTLLGGTASRCGLLSLIHCRATDNGGNAIHADDSAVPCYRMLFHNFETINNAWNTSIAGLVNAEIRVGGENQHFNQCAVSDQLGDTVTVTGQGRPRLAKSSGLSDGIYIGGNSRSITLTQQRFISTSRGVKTAASVSGLHLYVRGAYFTARRTAGGDSNQFFGFDIGSGYQCLDIEVEAGMPVNNMVITPTTGGRCKIGNVDGLVYGNSNGGILSRSGYVNATIASNSVNAQGNYINLLAPSATTLVAIVFAGGSNPLPPGEVIHFYNASGFTITLQNGTLAGYIRTKSGSNVTVPAGGRFSIVTDPSGNPYEL